MCQALCWVFYMLMSCHLHDILGTVCYPLLQRRKLRLMRGKVCSPRITVVGMCRQKQEPQTNDLETLELVGAGGEGQGGSPWCKCFHSSRCETSLPDVKLNYWWRLQERRMASDPWWWKITTRMQRVRLLDSPAGHLFWILVLPRLGCRADPRDNTPRPGPVRPLVHIPSGAPWASCPDPHFWVCVPSLSPVPNPQ